MKLRAPVAVSYGTDGSISISSTRYGYPVQEATHDSEQYVTPGKPPQADDWQM